LHGSLLGSYRVVVVIHTGLERFDSAATNGTRPRGFWM
jgi:hypothetical protein